MRRLLTALVAALAIGGCGGDRGTEPPVGSAEGFLDSVGVQTHVTYYDTAYGRFDEWTSLLRELGVRHVRDGVPGGDATAFDRLRTLGAMGLRLTLGAGLDADPGAAPAAAAGPLRGSVEAIEGPNEPQIFGGPDWESRLRGYVAALRGAVDTRGPRVPLLGPSFVPPADGLRFTAIAREWDVQNVHPYPGGGAPDGPLRDGFNTGRVAGPGKAVQATETGYHNALRHAIAGQQPPVSEAVAGVYMPRLLAAAYATGYRRTFIYELLDEKPDPALADPEQHFGLLRADLSPKPAFTAVRELLRAVRRSPGPGRERRVEVQGDVRRLLLQRRDGSRALLLWRDVSIWDRDARRPLAAAPVDVTLRFPAGAEAVSVTRPSAAAPARALGRIDRADLAIGPDVTVVSWR